MSDILVSFLGEKYSFPEELKRYVVYCNEFEKISQNLSKSLLKLMKKTTIYDQAEEIESRLKEKMRKEGRKIISLLAKDNIFDITESDLVDNNKGFIYYDEVYKNMMKGLQKNLADEIQGFLDGWDEAKRTAYSQITGTGISMYSNSLIAHMTLAAFETSTVKKQCEKADRDYEKAMSALSAKNSSERGKKDMLVMKDTFSGITKAFGMFTTELMETYLNKLQESSIFDYSKVKQYDIKRSSELLNNISMVDDKKSVLKQAFKNCPYNPDTYEKVLSLGFCDVETFITAKEFYQDSILVGVVEDYCKKNIENVNNIQNPIEILAIYKGRTKVEILKSLYGNKLSSIKKQYQLYSIIIVNKKSLDEWIRKNIAEYTERVISYSKEELNNKIHSIINKQVSEKDYRNFVSMGILSAEEIRLKDSKEETLEKINNEIETEISSGIDEYIQEARLRRTKYKDAYSKYEDEIKRREEKIGEKRKELNSLGKFSFSKKKELKKIISDMEIELSKYKREEEPEELKKAFENMYS